MDDELTLEERLRIYLETDVNSGAFGTIPFIAPWLNTRFPDTLLPETAIVPGPFDFANVNPGSDD